MTKHWHSLSRQMLLDGAPWITVQLEQVKLPNGVVIDDYFMLQTRSWVAVFAVTPDGRVPLVRQYRYGIDAYTLELPAGYIEPGEEPQYSAQRELREEVGYTAADFELLNSYHLMAPRGDMQMYVVLARDIRQIGEQALEPTEEIAVQWFTLDDLRAAWLDGAIGSANHAQAVARGLAAAGAL
jgi:ADP-ribose pyrophosphatase